MHASSYAHARCSGNNSRSASVPMAMTKYRDMGFRARIRGDAKGSCRYKREEIVAQWMEGWTKKDDEIAERKRLDAIPRWSLSRAGYRSDGAVEAMRLVGDSPPIVVHAILGNWFVSVYAFGIDSAPLIRIEDLDDFEAIQALAIRTVRRILADRIAKIDAVANEDGELRSTHDDD